MYRNSSRPVFRWDCIWLQSQLVGFSWEFTKSLEYVCIGSFNLFLCERQICNRKWMELFKPTTRTGEEFWRNLAIFWDAGTIHLRSLFRGRKWNCFRERNWMARYTFRGRNWSCFRERNWMAKYSFRGRNWMARMHLPWDGTGAASAGRNWIYFRGRNWQWPEIWWWNLVHFEFSQQIDISLEYPSRM